MGERDEWMDGWVGNLPYPSGCCPITPFLFLF